MTRKSRDIWAKPRPSRSCREITIGLTCINTSMNTSRLVTPAHGIKLPDMLHMVNFAHSPFLPDHGNLSPWIILSNYLYPMAMMPSMSASIDSQKWHIFAPQPRMSPQNKRRSYTYNIFSSITDSQEILFPIEEH